MRIKKSKGAMSATVDAKSLSDVLSALEGQSFEQKETFEVLKSISDPIINELKSAAPVDEGRVQRSIRMFRSAKRPYSQAQIGPVYIKGGGPDAGNAAHLTEFGTADRQMKEGLRYGKVTKNLERFKGPPEFTPYKGKILGRVQSKQWIMMTYQKMKKPTEQLAQNLILEKVESKAKKQGLTIK